MGHRATPQGPILLPQWRKPLHAGDLGGPADPSRSSVIQSLSRSMVEDSTEGEGQAADAGLRVGTVLGPRRSNSSPARLQRPRSDDFQVRSMEQSHMQRMH